MPAQDERDLVSRVLADYRRAYRSKQAKETLFRDIYQRYRSYLQVSRTASRSTLFIPESFTVVETVAPRMTSRKPSFKVLPRESSDIGKADSVGQLLDYFYDRTKLQHKLKVFAKQGLLYGTSFMKVGWDAKNEIPTHDPVDVADMFGDPTTYDWKTGFVIHRYYKTKEELKRSGIKYKNLDMLGKAKETNARDDQMRQDRQAVQGLPYDPERDGSEILEHWDWDEDGNLKVMAVADRSVLIRNDDNPNPLDMAPFVEFFDQEVPFEKWGIGEIEPIIDLQDEENTIRNQRIDEKNLSINNMWLVSKLSGIDYRTLVSKPGGIVLANDINGIKPLEKQNITQDSIQEIQMIKEDIQNATGVNDYVRGGDTGATTATETVSKTQEANQRFAEKVSNLEMAIKEIGEWDVAFAMAFMTRKVQMRVMGKFGMEVKSIAKSDIKGQYDIDIETGSSLPANPDLRRQQLTQLTELLVPVLSNPAGIPDGVRELLRELIQSFDLKNTDEILRGANPPAVSQALANLQPDELSAENPQMVEAEIRRLLTGTGQLNPDLAKQGGAPIGAAPQEQSVQPQPMPQMLQ